MSAFSFRKSKPNSRKTNTRGSRSKWTKSILQLEAIETRALPSTLTFVTSNTDFTNYTDDSVATPAAIPQFDTMGGTRTLTSVEIISTIEVDTSVSGTVTNHSGSTATYEATVTNASISVTGTGFTSPLTATQASLLDTGMIACPNNATTPISGFAASVANSSDFTLTGSDLLPFIGSGALS